MYSQGKPPKQAHKAIPEGQGTLLDHSMIVYGSGIGDGNRHNHDDLPILLCGRGRGTIKPARHLVYEPGTPLNNLYLSILDRVGARRESLGDSTGHSPDGATPHQPVRVSTP